MTETSNPPISVWFLNGPNANLYGLDSNKNYGTDSFPVLQSRCEQKAASLEVDLRFLQSNHEGQLIDWIHEAAGKAVGVVINPGGYTHTSVALRDAVAAVALPVIEVHISNIFAREEFRHHSHIAPVAKATLAGFGAAGYALAIDGLAGLVAPAAHAKRQG